MTTEDEMVGWHHQLDGQEFEQAPGFLIVKFLVVLSVIDISFSFFLLNL